MTAENEHSKSDSSKNPSSTPESSSTQEKAGQEAEDASAQQPLEEEIKDLSPSNNDPPSMAATRSSLLPPIPRTISGSSSQEDLMNLPVTSPSYFHDRLRECLSETPNIDLAKLRKLSSQGLPDEDDHCDGRLDWGKGAASNFGSTSYRGLTWRILLGYVPVEQDQWDECLTEKRLLYFDFVKDWFRNTYDSTPKYGGEQLRRKVYQPVKPIRRRKKTVPGPDGEEIEVEEDISESSHTESHRHDDDGGDDPPLLVASATTSSDEQEIPSVIKEAWKRRGRDLHILESVLAPKNGSSANALRWNDADVAKRQQDQNQADEEGSSQQLQKHHQQQQQHSQPRDPVSDLVESAKLLDEIRKDVVRTHPDLSFYLHPQFGNRRYAVIERILFCWSKYNRGVRYVQGMNEIVATLYYGKFHFLYAARLKPIFLFADSHRIS